MALTFPGSTIRWQLGRLIEALPGWSPTGGLPVMIWPSVETVLTYRSGGEQVTIPVARLSATVLADGRIVQDGKPLVLPRDVEGMSTRGLTWWAQVAGLNPAEFACPAAVTDIATYVGQAPIPGGGGGGGGGGLTAEQAQGMIDTHNVAADAHGMTVLGKSLLQAVSVPAARQALEAGRALSGTGSPETKVTGGVGDLYIDTAATLGAVVWVKTTASGATGWRVLSGDTGWRNLSGLLGAGMMLAASQGIAQIRRLPSEIQLILRLQVAPDATFIGAAHTARQAVLKTLPAGWAPSHHLALTCWVNGAVVWSINSFSSPAVLSCQGSTGNWAAGDQIPFALSIPTGEPWPTSLPGTAV